MKRLLCRLFGHRPPLYHGRVHYGRIIRGEIDGMGVEHAHVEAECDRCGERYRVIRIHLPADKQRVDLR